MGLQSIIRALFGKFGLAFQHKELFCLSKQFCCRLGYSRRGSVSGQIPLRAAVFAPPLLCSCPLNAVTYGVGVLQAGMAEWGWG